MMDRKVNDGGPDGGTQSESMDTLGQRIASLRRLRNLTQESLGTYIGVSKQVISSWEKDQVKNMTLENLFKLADALNEEPRFIALGHHNKIVRPLHGFPTSETGKFRLRTNRDK